MKYLKRAFIACFSFIMFAVIFKTSVSAVTVNPNTGQFTTGGTSEIKIYANSQTDETLVKLDLDFTNATVTNFVSADGGIFVTVLGECSGNTKFTANKICASFGASSTIPSGTFLGTATVKWGNSGTASIVATSGNLYRNTATSTDRIDAGTKATYTIGTTPKTDGGIPKTPLVSAEKDKYIFTLFGLLSIITGKYLYSKSKINEEPNIKN